MSCAIKATIIFLLLSACVGCAIFGGGNHRPAVRQLADQLNNVPLGTAVADIPCLSSNEPSPLRRVTSIGVPGFLLMDPTSKNDRIYLYRLKPANIILSLTEDDYYVGLQVKEDEAIDSLNGQVTAFFDASNHYLGYYAWSGYKAMGDSKERFARERYNFTNSGMTKACDFEKATRTMSSKEMRNLRLLPLAQHLAP